MIIANAYAQYRSDPDLQELHWRAPWIVVWDDHEVTNDAYLDGAQNHNDGEGDWVTRRTEALQAWHEWLPVRSTDDLLEINRSFDFGDLVSLTMLDTRLVGREQPFDLGSAMAMAHQPSLFANLPLVDLNGEQVAYLPLNDQNFVAGLAAVSQNVRQQLAAPRSLLVLRRKIGWVIASVLHLANGRCWDNKC